MVLISQVVSPVSFVIMMVMVVSMLDVVKVRVCRFMVVCVGCGVII